MWIRYVRYIALTISVLLIWSAINSSAISQDATAAASVQFGEVKAILRKHCGTCHNASEMRGGLDVMSEAAINAGADSGSVLVPGRPEESLLYLVTTHEADPKMPPNSPKIPQREVTILRRWIAGLTTNNSETNAVASSTDTTSQDVLQTKDDDPPLSMNRITPSNDPGNTETITSSAVAVTSTILTNKIAPLLSKAPIIASALHVDGTMMALAVNRQVVVLDVEKRVFVGAIDFPLGEIHAVTYSQDGKFLVVGGGEPGSSGGFVIYDHNSKPIFQWNEEFDVIQSLAISNNNSLVAVGSPKRIIRVIDIQNGNEKFVIKKHTDWLTALRFSPDGLLLASGDRFGSLYLWNAETGEEFANLKEQNGTVRGIHFSPTTDHLISASEDGFLRRFDLQTLELDKEWNCDIGGITSMTADSTLSGEPNFLKSLPVSERFGAGRVVVAGRHNKVKLYDFSGNLLWEDRVATTQVPSLCISPDACNIFATTAAGSVLSWLKDDHQSQTPIELPISAELNSQTLTRIMSQTPKTLELAQDTPETTDKNIDSEISTSAPSIPTASATISETRQVLAETEDVLGRFSRVASQLENELKKQEMLRTRDKLRTIIATHRRLMLSLDEYLEESLDDGDSTPSTNDSAQNRQAQQLKSALEKDLIAREEELAKVVESITNLGKIIESASSK